MTEKKADENRVRVWTLDEWLNSDYGKSGPKPRRFLARKKRSAKEENTETKVIDTLTED